MPISTDLTVVQGGVIPQNKGRIRTQTALLICTDASQFGSPQDEAGIVLDGRRGETIGRGTENSIILDAASISRQHASISVANQHWIIRDLGSSNGVFINDRPVMEARLKDGVIIKFGTIPFRFEVGDMEGEAKVSNSQAPHDDDDASGKTMLFRDVRASSRLLDQSGEDIAAAEIAERTVREKQKKEGGIGPIVKAAEKKDDAADAGVPKAKMPVYMRIFYGLCFILLFAAIYIAAINIIQRNSLESQRDAVNRFVRFEVKKNNIENFPIERKRILEIKNELKKLIEKDEKSIDLKRLLGQVIFLQVERNFYEAESAKKHDEARSVIAAARLELQKEIPEIFGDAEDISEQEAMLRVMEGIVIFNEFAEMYPNPRSKDVALSRSEFDNLVKRKEADAKLSKEINMNILTLPYLGEMLDLKKQRLRLLDRWQLVFRTNS